MLIASPSEAEPLLKNMEIFTCKRTLLKKSLQKETGDK